jgi:hypothetical protein
MAISYGSPKELTHTLVMGLGSGEARPSWCYPAWHYPALGTWVLGALV